MKESLWLDLSMFDSWTCLDVDCDTRSLVFGLRVLSFHKSCTAPDASHWAKREERLSVLICENNLSRQPLLIVSALPKPVQVQHTFWGTFRTSSTHAWAFRLLSEIEILQEHILIYLFSYDLFPDCRPILPEGSWMEWRFQGLFIQAPKYRANHRHWVCCFSVN